MRSFPMRPRVLWHLAFSPFGAALDAARAWWIAPHLFEQREYDQPHGGTLRITRRRPFTTAERVRRKCRAAVQVFYASVRLRRARAVLVTHFRTEGLLANVLHVLEVVRRIRPDARVRVDWRLTGTEIGFRYGAIGTDVWRVLFQPIDADLGSSYLAATAMLDYAFWGHGKDYLDGVGLLRHRVAYHKTICERLHVTNERVLAEVADVWRGTQSRIVVGIHRRVGNVAQSNVQRDGVVFPIDEYIRCARRCVETVTDWRVFIATDDADAVRCARREFGERLVVRELVRRTTADAVEVHFSDWGTVSAADAEDVLVDTLLLSRCDVIVHASSSISTMAALLNPAARLIRVGSRHAQSDQAVAI